MKHRIIREAEAIINNSPFIQTDENTLEENPDWIHPLEQLHERQKSMFRQDENGNRIYFTSSKAPNWLSSQFMQESERRFDFLSKHTIEEYARKYGYRKDERS